VYACGGRSLVSSVNFVGGQTVANAVFAPVSAAGTVCFFSSATTDLVVDINGWLKTGSGFSAVGPARVLDTRAGESPNALRNVPKVKIGGGNVLEVKVTDLAGLVPANGVTSVSLNVTATNPDADGFVTVFSCGTMEEVSSLNYSAGATVANAVLAPVSATGTICLFSNAPTDVVVDINGWIADTA
jgi:trimeric autotransporter adhesin